MTILNFRLIVFDLDGTLIDSRRDLADSVNILLRECGAEPLPETLVGRMVGDGAATLVKRAFAASDREPPADALDRFLAIYDRHLLNHTRPYDAIPDVLATLRSHTQLAILTNKPRASTERILAGLDLARHFSADSVIGGDGPFPRKPAPAGLQHLAASAGVPAADTLLVGDSIIDWRTARHASSAICVARYGFGFEGFPVEKLAPGDRAIDTPQDLLRL